MKNIIKWHIHNILNFVLLLILYDCLRKQSRPQTKIDKFIKKYVDISKLNIVTTFVLIPLCIFGMFCTDILLAQIALAVSAIALAYCVEDSGNKEKQG